MAERLVDVIARLDAIPEADRYEVGPAIYAKFPFHSESEALVLSEDPVDFVSPSAPGLKYLLDVDTAKEVLEVWSVWRGGEMPNEQQAVAAIIHYALNDAYQPLG